MFCPKCRTENAKNSLFCSECGVPFHSTLRTTPGKRHLKTTKSLRKLSHKILLVFMSLFSFLAILTTLTVLFFPLPGMHNTKPENLVNDLGKACLCSDSSSIFHCFQFPSSPLLTPSQLHKRLSVSAFGTFPSSYQINERPQSSSAQRSFDISFLDNQNRIIAMSNQILVKKDGSQSLFFFDNWVLDGSSYLTTNCNISIPETAQVSIDGIPIDPTYRSTTNPKEVQLPPLFSGTHTITLKEKNYQDFTTSFTVSATDYQHRCAKTITLSQLTLSPSVKNDLELLAQDFFKQLYSNAFAKNSFEVAFDGFHFDPGSLSLLKNSYSTFVNNNIKGRSYLKSLDILSLETSSSQVDYNSFQNLDVAVNVAVTYKATSFVESPQADNAPFRTYNGTGNYTFHYVFNNGQWNLSSTTALDYCVPYTKY